MSCKPVSSSIALPCVTIIRHILTTEVTICTPACEYVVSTTLSRDSLDSMEISITPEPPIEFIDTVLDIATNRTLVAALKVHVRNDRNTYTLLSAAVSALQDYRTGWYEAMTTDQEQETLLV